MMLLSTAAIGLTSVAAVSTSSAADVEKSMALSGQVNRVTLMGDDGEDTFITHGDGNTSGSRMRVRGSAKSESMEIGFLNEFGFQAERRPVQTAAGDTSFAIRHSTLYARNNLGRLDVGFTAHAGESFSNVDVSGTGIASGATATALDGLVFNDSSTITGSQAAGPTVLVGYGGGMGAGRSSGVSYSTPSLNGFGFKASHRTDASGSYEATYGGDFNGVALRAGYSYANVAGGTNDNVHGGGVGITLPGGLNLSANYRQTELEDLANTANNGDPETYYGKVGYKLSGISDLGGTSVAVEYRKTEDENLTGDDFESVGFLFVQALSDYGTSVYGGFTNISYTTALSNFDDINAFWMGARVTF
jgi:hypothetical protein